MNTRLQQKILMHIADHDGDNCWLWRGQISNSGYGRIKYKDEHDSIRMQSADYVSYLAFIGPIPSGMVTRQTCHNRLCVNPGHLELFDPRGAQEPG